MHASIYDMVHTVSKLEIEFDVLNQYSLGLKPVIDTQSDSN